MTYFTKFTAHRKIFFIKKYQKSTTIRFWGDYFYNSMNRDLTYRKFSKKVIQMTQNFGKKVDLMDLIFDKSLI